MTSELHSVLVIVGIVLAVLTLPGTLWLAVLTLAGLLPPARRRDVPAGGRIAIVVPAHNEESRLPRTLASLLAECRRDGDAGVIVVADNCTDGTAGVARHHGARVLVRDDPAKRGKGYALDHAFGQLLREEFRYFVVVDADSELDAGFLDAIRRHFAAGADVVQARYTVLNAGDSLRTRFMELALAAFNVLRPRGRAALGFSAGLLGNGFALRREVLQALPYAAGSIVEDLEYHLVLVFHGAVVAFADDARVRGEMPASGAGVRQQRLRWEGGRLRMLLEHAPGLAADLLRGRGRAAEPLLDLLLPPLAYHAALLGALLLLPLDWARLIGLGGLAVLGLHVLAATIVCRLPASRLLLLACAPFYVAWKILLLPATVAAAARDHPWVRTARETVRDGVRS
jgi:cellulose synthase/poly-beta-1,6-N-acetylglucosamine synthase-like glycosyltransferase